MDVKLGIDTGGTYTDATIVSCETLEVIKYAKARTTKEDLAIGINRAIEALGLTQEHQVRLVCLSTTLATNAIVEGRGCRVALITIGDVDAKNIPVVQAIKLKGKISVTGCELVSLSEEEVEKAVLSLDPTVEAVAISGYASVRNPIHEEMVRKIVEQLLHLPTVCAHQLTSSLGFYERTITTVFNARLSTLIRQLIDAVHQALKEKQIEAPIYVVKGNGHVMIDHFAVEKAVETIMSGPAASTLGGSLLAEKTDCIVADMGGTTLDVVPVINGKFPVDIKGAIVGGWRTRVKAISASTYGLGGDSVINLDYHGKLKFGPTKAEPFCVAAQQYPGLLLEMKEYETVSRQDMDCYMLVQKQALDSGELGGNSYRIAKALAEGPHSTMYLSRKLDCALEDIHTNVQAMKKAGIIQIISLTPTDILHVLGEYTEWNTEASVLACQVMARHMGVDADTFARYAQEQFVYEMALAIVTTLWQAGKVDTENKTQVYPKHILASLMGESTSPFFHTDVKLKLPIVGIGAPAGIWMPKVAKLLGADVVIPAYSQVANAYGAASGNIREDVQALIRFNRNAAKFVVFTKQRRELFESMQEAKAFAETQSVLDAKILTERLGLENYEVSLKSEDRYSDYRDGIEGGFVEAKITAIISRKLERFTI